MLDGGAFGQVVKAEAWNIAVDVELEGYQSDNITTQSVISETIAKAPEHDSDLSEDQCIHRDLAARNVLIDEHNVCKISYFGLAHDVIEEDQYERNTQARLPIRWMSMESLLDGIFTTMSDVWSFGIVLWEIATMGYKPYPGMSGQEVISSLHEGSRMPKLLNCDEEFYAVMSSCWHKEPGRRPTFSDLVRIIKELAKDDKDHISVYPVEQDDTKADGCEDD
ncbi:fibroblast growth factor receptor 3-like [Ptychodera flava]|uniref:fibroblast growth factor receptor 3-like n=1 Tax=Ptychodera flava TaxID=63121 RepID=UPI00396A56F7